MKIILKGELTDLNAYIKALNSHYIVGNRVKKHETERVCYAAKGIKPITNYPVRVSVTWFSKNERKDIDNVAFAKKFILDGLVMAKVLENDSRKFVRSLADDFEVDKDNPRVEIEIAPYEQCKKES